MNKNTGITNTSEQYFHLPYKQRTYLSSELKCMSLCHSATMLEMICSYYDQTDVMSCDVRQRTHNGQPRLNQSE